MAHDEESYWIEKWKPLEDRLREKIRNSPMITKDGMVTHYVLSRNGLLGDMATEWWTELEWATHREEIRKMKLNGTYMMPFISTITMISCPRFDEPVGLGATSYAFTMLNLGEQKEALRREQNQILKILIQQNMSDFKERLRVENEELGERISRLKEFLASPNKPADMDPIQLDLMNVQLMAMQSYHKTLTLRISLLK